MILDNAAEMRAETLSPDIFPALTCADVAALDRPVLLLNGELSPRLFHLINAELARCLPRANPGGDSTYLTRDPRGESRGVSCGGARVSSNASAPYMARYFWCSVLPVGRRRRGDWVSSLRGE